MVNKTCPHLGRRDDSSTVFNYPSVGNSCHHARPLAPPSEEHQFEYCLAGRFRECPVFQAPTGKRLPPSIQMADWVDPNTLQGNIFQRVSLWQLGLLVFLGVVILIGLGLIVFLSSGGYLGNPNQPEATSTLIPTHLVASPTLSPFAGTEVAAPPLQTPFPPLTPSASPTETPSNTPVSTPTLVPNTFTPLPTSTQVCTLPPGWVTYFVQAGDTLSKLSLATGATIAQLQQANCLGNSTQIITGQRLFVPKLPETPTATVTPIVSPTSTLPVGTLPPSATPTHTPVPPTATFIPPSPTNTSPPPSNTPTPSSTPIHTPTKIDEPTQPVATPTLTTEG